MDRLQRAAIGAAVCAGVILALAAATRPEIEIQLGGKFGEFRVINHGKSIQLNSAVKVQQKVGGEWQDTPVSNFYLIPSCGKGPVPDCVSLLSGATLQPVPWRGNYCFAQCIVPCNLDGPVPSGTYRYVLTSCDRKRKFVSASFERK